MNNRPLEAAGDTAGDVDAVDEPVDGQHIVAVDDDVVAVEAVVEYIGDDMTDHS